VASDGIHGVPDLGDSANGAEDMGPLGGARDFEGEHLANYKAARAITECSRFL